jgi:hypothetical protein
MRAPWVVLFVGLLAAMCAFCGFYFLGTASHRDLLSQPTPELAWLKKEFGLSDAELARIAGLHQAYQPHCEVMCRRIDEQHTKLNQLLANTDTLTPEIEGAIAAAAALRADCQRDMLRHFLEVSRTMPAGQRRRYLAWISERTFLPAPGMQRVR